MLLGAVRAGHIDPSTAAGAGAQQQMRVVLTAAFKRLNTDLLWLKFGVKVRVIRARGRQG